DALPLAEAADDLPGGPDEPPAGRTPRIEELLSVGQEVLVQAAKDPIAQKGARITSHLALPGRFLVCLPGVDHVGVSRRITDPERREQLRCMVDGLRSGRSGTAGFIVRTAGEGASAQEFQNDVRELTARWQEIRRLADTRPAPALLHQEVGALGKALRDLFGPDIQQVIVDTDVIYERAVTEVGRRQPELSRRIHLHTGRAPLFEERGVETQLERALRQRVWLKSGGSIVINQTEALVAIDVNTGKYVGTRRLEETILKTNLEASLEIVRQVRLRDLGGIIVVDFIDMEEAASREEVIASLQTELRKDRSRSRVLQISEFGLVEITRQRTRPSLERLLCEPCAVCHGSGRVKSAETIYFEIVRAARRVAAAAATGSLLVRVPPSLRAFLEAERERLAEALDQPVPPRISIQADDSLGPGQFAVEPFASA
ncbi:MAG TPA: Rne/Rng family ribonuclease, partial [Candidatus Polarisedimenticolia bacterium]|nr:Rne/Rng family ribonuclease [Candidatus Polarisedimenticolia bacterium]